MQEILVRALHAKRGRILLQWEALLRVERTTSPLAHPDSLVYLLPWAIDEIFSALQPDADGKPVPAPPAATVLPSECACGRNPYLVFFIAGEQALNEALVLAQTEIPALDAASRDSAVSELYAVLSHLRDQEIESFCALCTYRRPATCTDVQPVAPCNRAR